jgi:hypothetical protein
MSRGLGTQQRMLLQALRNLEQERGEAWVEVHAVIRAAWPLGWSEGHERRQAEAAAWAAEDARDRAETASLAAAGDDAAKKRMDWFMHRDMLASRWRRRNAHRGAPQLRPAKDVDATLNPSRILALLAKRGYQQDNEVAFELLIVLDFMAMRQPPLSDGEVRRKPGRGT